MPKNGFLKRALSACLAGVMCLGACVPAQAASVRELMGVDSEMLAAEVPEGIIGGIQSTAGGRDGISGQADGNSMYLGSFSFSVPLQTNKNGLLVGNGVLANVSGGSWPGKVHSLVESKESASGTVVRNMDVPSGGFNWPGTASGTVIKYQSVLWKPNLAASRWQPPAVELEGVVTGPTTWEARYGANAQYTNVYHRSGFTYDYTGTGNISKPHMEGWNKNVGVTDADGWVTIDYYDVFDKIYVNFDDNSQNHEVSPSSPNMTDQSAAIINNTSRNVGRVLEGHAELNAAGQLTAEGLKADRTEVLDAGSIAFPKAALTNATVDAAGMYFHVTVKSLSGNTTNKVVQIPPAYQIKYDTQGGSAISPSTKVFTGYTRNVTSEVPKKPGATFLGWYRQPNKGGAKEEAGAELTLTSDVTLYAAWEQKYTITTSVEGGTIDPSVEIPAGTTKTITYKPSGNNVIQSITVDGVELTEAQVNANKGGYRFPSIDKNHTIHVVFAPEVQKIFSVSTNIVNGEISDGRDDVEPGEDVDVQYTPDPGYYVDRIIVDGEEVDPEEFPDTYTFEDIHEDHDIMVYCEKCLKVETDVQNGTITPTDDQIRGGDSKKVDYSPDEGYHLVSVTVDGTSLDIEQYPSTYTFSDIHEDHVIRVVYEKDAEPEKPKYKVETSINHGDITKSRGDVVEGSDVTVDFRPADGFYVDKVVVDGKDVDLGDKMFVDFPDIDADHTVTVTCKPYLEVTTEVSGGTITDSMLDVKEGESREVTYSPNSGYHLEYIEIDGERVDDVSSIRSRYEFSNITGNHHVKVVYAKDATFTVTATVVNGTISGGKSGLAAGSEVDIVFSPDAGYRLSAIIIDGKIMDAAEMAEKYGTGSDGQVYKFTDIRADHTIRVEYEEVKLDPVDESVEIEIWKTIEKPDSVPWPKGGGVFQFRIDGYDSEGNRVTLYREIVLDEENPAGHVTVTLPKGNYHVTELESDGWDVSGTARTQTPEELQDGSGKKRARVEFTNKTTSYKGYTGNHSAVNELKK